MPADNPGVSSSAALAGDARAIQHLRQAVANGTHWYRALLEAIRLWRSPEEQYRGERYLYLVGGEAFDWLRLAERLCDEITDTVSPGEVAGLLFFDKPPLELNEGEFKELIGATKYRAYLNYLYGVLTEEALILASVYEVRKKSIAPLKPDVETEKAYRRIYSAGQAELLEAFRREMKYSQLKSMTLTEVKEFTYWLFRYRVKRCEKSRVASDTKKALMLMHRKMSKRRD